ncbi:MAG: ATP-binding cassette domain-containing protein [Deltaproteobacteria bacterium]|nr:ATP-binding cassette domain-containing protein [Deltaproteobacteria bacterium]
MIQLIDLHKSFNGQKVLDGVNLTIPTARITVVIGKSGVGKSVLLKHIIGLLKPDAGRILVDGVDIATLRGRDLREFKKHFAVLFQGGALFDSLSVFENIAFPLREKTGLSEAEIAQRVRLRLEQMHLTSEVEAKFPDELSGGMKKRVALARAMIQEPEIILFDEPVTGLDPPMTNTVFHLIKQTHQDNPYTALVVAHDIPEVFSIADQVAMLHQGRIVACGTPAEIQGHPDPVVQSFIKGEVDFLEG